MRSSKTIVMVLALGVSAWTAAAQPAGDPPRRHGPPPGEQHRQPGDVPGEDGHRPPPPPPVIGALDANHDRVISAEELANATAALKTLDKNNDGQLTNEELRPQHRPPGGEPPEGAKPPAPPLMKALDANGDGIISVEEIANAAVSLRALDKNSDGQLTIEELRLPGAGLRGPRGPGGPGGPGNPEFDAHHKEILGKHDANKDGKLDETERAAIKKDIEAGKLERPQGRRGPRGFGPPPGDAPAQ